MTGQQLKNSILQLAIQGKLVPQDPNDEPASELLKRIRKEKEQMVKAGKLKKKDLEVTPIAEDEKPFELPNGWEWCRLGDLAQYKKGPFGSSLTKSMFVPQSNNSIKVYEQKNAIQKDYRLGDYYITKEKYLTMEGFTVKPFDIIVSCAGTIGETYQIPATAPVGIINQALMYVRLYDLEIADYWMLFFADLLNHNTSMKGAGSAIKNIPPFDVLKKILVPLPPITEQRRIICRYKELLPKVEEYGNAQEELNKLNATLPDKLRQSILQEAIMGKLVPQDPNDEPASKLLERIQEEKKRLVKEGKLKKKDLEVTPITDDEKLFKIPDSWEWVRLSNLGITYTGTTPSKSHLEYFGNEIPFIGPGDIQNGKINYKNNGLSALGYEFARPVKQNTILQVCIGGSIGKAAICDREITFNQQINAITTIFVDYRFLYFCMTSDLYIKEMIANSTGTATPIINRGSWDALLIPLPPLAEQHRIVAKLEEILPKLNELK